MPWFQKYLNGGNFKMKPDGDPPGGGGDPKPDLAKQFAELAAQNKALAEKLEALEKKNGTPPKTDPKDDDLSEQARKREAEKNKNNTDAKKLEAAIKFNLGAPEWYKTNAELLPKTVEGILDLAKKETYESPIDRDSAIKAGIIKEFFSVQENVDLLTDAQKQALAEYEKLTNIVKQDRAQSFYDQVFEPTFETLKRVKKAGELSKGAPITSSAEEAYRKKLIEGSKRKYLGEK